MENLIAGFHIACNPENLLIMAIGTIAGYFIGAMPGLTATIGMALLIPFTYGMNSYSALILLMAVFNASFFGGGITAVLVNTPGTPSAAVTCFDGYPLARQGKAKKALGMLVWASAIGMFFSFVLMIIFAVPLAVFSLRFGPPEYFVLAIMGLSVVAGLSPDNLNKGMIMVALGLFFTTIGIDPITGNFRYVVDFHLLDGIPFVPVMIGLFAVSEVFSLITEGSEQKAIEKIVGEGLTVKELLRSAKTLIKGTLIGFFVGVVPAAGPNIASFLSYNEAKRSSKTPENYGKGELDGIAAGECANNAACGGSLVTTLVLGIPGSSPAAVLIGALMLHGITPGPMLFAKRPEIPYTIFATTVLAVPLMIAIGVLCARVFALVTLVPKSVLAAIVLATCTVGSYAVSGSMYGVWIAYIFGVLGYFAKRLNFPVAPMVLAVVLGRMAESNFRLSMLMGGAELSIFFTRPLSILVIILTLLMFAAPLLQTRRQQKKASADTGGK